MPKDQASFVHVTFANAKYKQPLELLQLSARRYGIADLRVYDENHPVIERLRREQPETMKAKRGFGYWLWKPHIIADAMAGVPDGSLVLYTDAAVVYRSHPAPFLALARDRDVVTIRGYYLQSQYTKRDCFVLLGVDNPKAWNMRQLNAAFLIMKTGDPARALLRDWVDALRDPRVLTDMPNTCGLPNLKGFIDHRHDQSALSIIAARHGIVPVNSPSIPNNGYGWIFHHHDHARFVPPLAFSARRFGLRFGLWPNSFSHWRHVVWREKAKAAKLARQAKTAP